MDFELPYASRRMPVLAANVVATSQPLAAQAGLRMLLSGGNAVDAALATAIALAVVEPTSNGIGSDAFAILWDGERLHGLNASGRSPAALTPDRFAGRAAMPRVGWDTVTVPGAVSAWVELSGRFGRLPFEHLFEPAIAYARDGFLVAPVTARAWSNASEVYAGFEEFRKHFLPQGRAPRAGERFRYEEQACTLEHIAKTRGEAFYTGDLASAMARASRDQGGLLSEEDLSSHRVDWVGTLSTGFDGIDLHEIPPNGQGLAALIMLGILRHHPAASASPDSADGLHVQIEAMKLAFVDAHRYIADPATMDLVAGDLLDDGYLAERAGLIDMKRAREPVYGVPRRGGDRLSERCRCGWHDGVVHPVELPGFRFRRGGARHRYRLTEPRLRFYTRTGPPKPGRGWQTAFPHDHSRLRYAKGTARSQFRRDGRSDAAAGARADGTPHLPARPEPTGGFRCSPVASERGAHG